MINLTKKKSTVFILLLLILCDCGTDTKDKAKLKFLTVFYLVSRTSSSSSNTLNFCNLHSENSKAVNNSYVTNVFAHALISSESDVPPRGEAMKDPPCGVNQRTNNPVSLKANSQITLRWKETVNHPGFYWIEFSKANDMNWYRLKTIVDTQNNTNDLPHLFETTINVPDVNCENCTIRVVQEMTENPFSPTYYYSCGDIKITGGKC